MGSDLIKRWMAIVDIHGEMSKVKGGALSSYCNSVEAPEEIKLRMRSAIESVDVKAIEGALETFAEENFSDDALEAAVAFFESPIGLKYQHQRDRVMDASKRIIASHFGAAIQRAMEDLQ